MKMNTENDQYEIQSVEQISKEDASDSTHNTFLRIKKTPKWLFLLIMSGSILLISALLVGFGLIWQWQSDLLAICNAFYFSGAILFSFGLIVYASNNNIFSPLVYGTKTFVLMFAGKKPKLSYYDYVQDTKNHQIPKYLVFYPLIASIPNLAVAIVLHVIFNLYYYQPV